MTAGSSVRIFAANACACSGLATTLSTPGGLSSMVRNCVAQTPWKSGSPFSVRGTEYCGTWCAGEGGACCASAGATADRHATASNSVTVEPDLRAQPASTPGWARRSNASDCLRNPAAPGTTMCAVRRTSTPGSAVVRVRRLLAWCPRVFGCAQVAHNRSQQRKNPLDDDRHVR